jgi:hypothetical protein
MLCESEYIMYVPMSLNVSKTYMMIDSRNSRLKNKKIACPKMRRSSHHNNTRRNKIVGLHIFINFKMVSSKLKTVMSELGLLRSSENGTVYNGGLWRPCTPCTP